MGSELLIDDSELPKETQTMSRLFWDAYPAYIAMGMPSEEYWNGDAQSCIAYRKAYEERLDMQDMYAWRQGLYVYHALCAVAPYFNSIKPRKPEDYPKPFSQLQKEKAGADARTEAKKKQDNFKAIVTLWAINVNKRRAEQKKQDNGN